MWPWGHLAVGYLCYVTISRVDDNREQTLATLVAVTIGTQVPDLVDKPLAWTLGVLPSGRSLAHSLLVAAVIIAIVSWGARYWHRQDIATAFGIGYVSHSLVDLGPGVIWGLLRGDWSQLEWTTYLLWPILSAPPYPHDESFQEHFVGFVLDPYMVLQFGLFGLAIVVWWQSGTPGLGAVRQKI